MKKILALILGIFLYSIDCSSQSNKKPKIDTVVYVITYLGQNKDNSRFYGELHVTTFNKAYYNRAIVANSDEMKNLKSFKTLYVQKLTWKEFEEYNKIY